ncbi:TPR domain-containing protein [Cercophora samala]|uniref:TPR domain-containing protein n=1 Tax=Cercophora samala TaxID=330535 RepID=A0AA39Z9C1_9PEZI|nr:TPR domain-containing protein [Cercophora samala]
MDSQSTITDRLALFEESPSREVLEAIIRDLQDLLLVENSAHHLNRLGYCLLQRFSFTEDAGDLDKSLSTLREAFQAARHDVDLKVKAANNLGDALCRRWETSKHADSLTDCVSYRQFAARHTPILDASITGAFMDLADALNAKYEQLSLESDLEEAARAQRLAVLGARQLSITPDDSDRVDLLALLLRDSFFKTGNRYALDESIIWRQKLASSTTARDADQFLQVTRDLSISLLDRYRLNFVPGDLQGAIHWARETVSALPTSHEKYPAAAYQLAVCLQKEWDRTDSLETLREEIRWYSESLKDLDDDDNIKTHRHNLLGVALCQKADRARDESEAARDIESAARHLFAARDRSEPGSDEHVRALNNLSNLYESAAGIVCSLTPHAVQGAVEAAELAVALKPDAELPLYNLCKALTLKYERTACRPALERCVELGRKLCQKFSLPRNFGCLLTALVHQFHATASSDLLDEAVSAGLESISKGSLDSANGSKRLVGLGNALVLRAEWIGGLDEARKDVSEGIGYLQQACAIMSSKTGGIPRGYRSNLAAALMVRYDLLKAEQDVTSAIRTYEDALAIPQSREAHLLSSIHSNLASALMKRFILKNGRNDLREAIRHGQDAVELASDNDPRLHVRYNNLAVSLQAEAFAFGEANGSDGMTRAIELYAMASKLAGRASAAYPGYQNNTGLARIYKVKNYGDPEGIELQGAIDELSEALPLAQGEGPLYGGILLNLAQAWHIKFELDLDEVFLKQAIAYSRETLETTAATVAMRIVGAYHAGIWTLQIAQGREDQQKAAELLREAARLLPLLSPTDMALHDRVRNLAEFNTMDITADAVAATLDVNDKDEAMCLEAFQLFEAGRRIIVGNLLERRVDLVSLASAHPLLAKQYEELQDAYVQAERLATLQAMKVVQFANLAPATDELDPHRLRLARMEQARRTLLDKIRTDAPFRNFPGTGNQASPADLEPLNCPALDGYVVALNASRLRCDAFILHKGQLTILHLDQMKYSELRRRDNRLREALRKERSARAAARNEVVDMLRWLWTCCGKPIIDTIIPNRSAESTPKPRVWWMAGGVLGRLPLHACGNYTKRSSTAYDCLEGMQHFAISSYIPTIKSLELAAEQADSLDDNLSNPSKALIVGVSKTGFQGETELPSTKQEVEKVQQLLGGESTSRALLNPPSAEVINELSSPQCLMAHFACHGISDDDDSSRSYLRLPDFESDPLTVHALMRMKMACRFAYLSACDTASSKHPALVDESLHLANGFLLAGCVGVVGTLWKIPDEEAPEVAAQFYSRLPWKGGQRDTRRAAVALHEGVAAMWESEMGMRDPLALAAYVHCGY